MNQNEDLNSFLISTAEIGKDFNFVQGAGGNTSYKNGNQLLIKASGFKLKNANVQNIFAEVNLKKLRNNIQNDWHYNRLSMVFYLRENMLRCKGMKKV